MTTEPNEAHALISNALVEPLHLVALDFPYEPDMVADVVMKALAPVWQIVRVQPAPAGRTYWVLPDGDVVHRDPDTLPSAELRADQGWVELRPVKPTETARPDVGPPPAPASGPDPYWAQRLDQHPGVSAAFCGTDLHYSEGVTTDGQGHPVVYVHERWLREQLKSQADPVTTYEGQLYDDVRGSSRWIGLRESVQDLLIAADVECKRRSWQLMFPVRMIATGPQVGQYEVVIDEDRRGHLDVTKVQRAPVLADAQAWAVKGWVAVAEWVHSEYSIDSVSVLMGPGWGAPADAPDWLRDGVRAALHATEWATA